MDIKPSEIDFVEEIGALDGAPVKMIRTHGGFYIAVGKPKSKKQDEALAAGSHPAIVRYNVEKNFSGFQATLAKSETAGFADTVTGYSELLPAELRNRGYDMYSLQKSNDLNYVLTRHGYEVHKFSARLTPDSVEIDGNNKTLPPELKDFSIAVAEAAAQKAVEAGKEYVAHRGYRFDAKKLLGEK